jgi:hypothetical protein
MNLFHTFDKKKIWKIEEICTNMHFCQKYAQGV